jgi:hypothetical protein
MYKKFGNFLKDSFRMFFQILAILFQKNIEFMTKKKLKISSQECKILHPRKAF